MIQSIKYRLFAAAIWLSAFGYLAGCSSAPVVNVHGGCELPAAYQSAKADPVDVPLSIRRDPTSGNSVVFVDPKVLLEEGAKERHQHKLDVDDFNGLRSYVETNCK